jgi:thioesterase domain-containing protein
MLALCQAHQILPEHVDMDMVKRILSVYQAGAHAAASYQAPPPATTVTLFAADRAAGEDLSLGWGDLLGAHLQVEPIGGTHVSIVRPPWIEKLGAAIFQAISSRKTREDSSITLRRRQ